MEITIKQSFNGLKKVQWGEGKNAAARGKEKGC